MKHDIVKLFFYWGFAAVALYISIEPIRFMYEKRYVNKTYIFDQLDMKHDIIELVFGIGICGRCPLHINHVNEVQGLGFRVYIYIYMYICQICVIYIGIHINTINHVNQVYVQPIADGVGLNLEIILKTVSTNQLLPMGFTIGTK